jgi:hypothetical protein
MMYCEDYRDEEKSAGVGQRNTADLRYWVDADPRI